MGLFDNVMNFGKSLIEPVVTFVSTGGNIPATVMSTAGSMNRKPKVLERSETMMFPGDPGIQSGQLGFQPSNQGGFFSNLGQTALKVSEGIGEFASNISPLAGMFGAKIPSRFTSTGPAVTISNQLPSETASSGELLGANLGMGNLLMQGGRRFIGSPFGQGVLGGAAGSLAMSGGSGRPGTMRITRKMKSDVRRIYMMSGMNPQATADILNSMGTFPNFSFDADLVFFILLKRFRNDGPVVTKAAVRKTRQTLRRMKGIVDMYNATCKPTTRRAPMRRAAPKAVQLIKN